MNATPASVLNQLSRKALNALRSLPVRLIAIFVASLVVMSMGVTTAAELFPYEQNPVRFRIFVYGMCAAAIGGCYLAVRHLFRPLEDIRFGTRQIGDGQLDHRLPIRRRDEFGRLSERINRMADEVQRMLAGQRQLLLALSHELRTPLTRARLALEFINDKEVRGHLEYDLSNMQRMITELLEGERLNTRSRELSRSCVNLADLIMEVMQGDFPDELERLSLSLPAAPAHLDVSAARLRILVRNLVENALRYNPGDGPPVKLGLEMGDGIAIIRVQDHGPGIDREHLEQVTHAFFRADPSRGAGTGRHGLGLYLCRLIAEAHGGRIKVASPPGSGACITAHIPGAPPA